MLYQYINILHRNIVKKSIKVYCNWTLLMLSAIVMLDAFSKVFLWNDILSGGLFIPVTVFSSISMALSVLLLHLNGQFTRKLKSVNFYSPSCNSESIRLSFVYKTQMFLFSNAFVNFFFLQFYYLFEASTF